MSLDLSSRPRTGTNRGHGISVAALVIALLGALLQTACPGGAELDDADSFVGAGGTSGSGGSGTGGGATGGAGTGGGAACDIPKLLNDKCSSSICHGTAADLPTPPLGTVNLIAPGVEGRIYDIDATYANITAGSTDCPTTSPEKLLDSAGLSMSLMYTKINGGHACGAPMPNVGTMNAEQITCYNAWLGEILASPPTN